MSSDMLFTPEVEEILREVASDPRSSLLKISRPEHLRGHFERYSNVGPHTAGLTVAERELLQVHRSEVARLLGDMCRTRLAADTVTVHQSLSVDRKVRIYSESELKAHVEEIEARGDLSDAGIGGLLERCVAGSHRAPSVVEIATAMGRLEPTDTARVLAGMGMTTHDRPRAALDLYRVVLAGRPSRVMASQTWDNVARAFSLLGDSDQALSASLEACYANSEKVESRFVSLCTAFDLGYEDVAFRMATEVNELVPANHESVDWYVASMTSRRKSGVWVPSEASRLRAGRIGDRFGDAAGRIVDVST